MKSRFTTLCEQATEIMRAQSGRKTMNEAILVTLQDMYERVPSGTWQVHNPRDSCRPDRREIWSTDDMGNEERVCNLPDAGHNVAELIAAMYNEFPNLLTMAKKAGENHG